MGGEGGVTTVHTCLLPLFLLIKEEKQQKQHGRVGQRCLGAKHICIHKKGIGNRKKEKINLAMLTVHRMK